MRLSTAHGQGVHPVGTEYIGATLISGDDESSKRKATPFDSSEIYGEGDLIRLSLRDDD
jgi:hypothetical protein